ncbi:threonine dehydrogenase-like Zn-dependent dehydrogenase [Halanaerobium saccharolyticum]|uniref:Threonine dehydrogenase-like Zn-dependent dehydrogenase n=1 Tax=Halanaerobium saccharolyticum TaxID=43595 RepID=A0A4V3CDW5_9FIRM|nr:zinc-binding alcohol dehydrogenase [Halanaerobium saccharolyticum]TDO83363.1 threonine dehydrogenase-like Zn-dependent dehydrogenase [Halanaerobium saccharolyticum]
MGKVLALIKPGKIEIMDYEEKALQPDEVRVKTLYSGISAGTELTSYRGDNPHLNKSWNSDLRIFEDKEEKKDSYPITNWGYEEVGEIIEIGSAVEKIKLGDTVYGTWGHRTKAVLTEDFAADHRLPEDADPIYGIFSHIGSIALNAILDADIHVGETAAVFGQGVPGQIVTQLAKLNGARVIALDLNPKRLETARRMGADIVFNPAQSKAAKEIKKLTGGRGADVSIEISGSLKALHQAVKSTAYSGRTIASGFFAGSSQGLNLGEEFHHNRIQLICSQISGVRPELSYRWNRLRLNQTIMDLQQSKKIDLKGLITNIEDFNDAEKLFKKLNQEPEETLQTVLKFD